MRFPVFARRSNPSIDRPIMRKKMAYLEAEVLAGTSEWIDPHDKRQGIIAREMIYFGPRPLPSDQPSTNSLGAEIPGLVYRGPTPPWRVNGMIRETPVQCELFA